MNLDFATSLVLVFLVVVLFVIGNILYNFKKRKALENKVRSYEKMLLQASQIRLKYMESMKNADDAKKKMELLKEEMTSRKMRLRHLRADLLKQMQELQKLKNQVKEDNVGSKLLAQRKVTFSQQWKLLNGFKKSYSEAYATLRAQDEKFSKMLSEEQKGSDKWQRYRNTVVSLYNELNPKIDIDNPRDVLGGATNETTGHPG